MATRIFVNLPVRDLSQSIEFFTKPRLKRGHYPCYLDSPNTC
jgi:predicted lactoylglutathione lyase